MRNRARRTQISQNEPNLAVRRTQISWNEPTLRPRRSQIATNEPSRRAAPNCANEPNGVGHELRERTQTRNARADYSGFADQSIGVWPASSTNEPNAVVLHREMRERTQSRGIVPAKCANEPKIVGQTRRTKPGSPAGRARKSIERTQRRRDSSRVGNPEGFDLCDSRFLLNYPEARDRPSSRQIFESFVRSSSTASRDRPIISPGTNENGIHPDRGIDHETPRRDPRAARLGRLARRRRSCSSGAVPTTSTASSAAGWWTIPITTAPTGGSIRRSWAGRATSTSICRRATTRRSLTR